MVALTGVIGLLVLMVPHLCRHFAGVGICCYLCVASGGQYYCVAAI